MAAVEMANLFLQKIICYVLSEATTTVLKSFTSFTKSTCFGVYFKKICRPAGLFHACVSLYLIIHVINLFFNYAISIYFSYFNFILISSLANRGHYSIAISIIHLDLDKHLRSTCNDYLLKKIQLITESCPLTVFYVIIQKLISPRKSEEDIIINRSSHQGCTVKEDVL